MGMGVTCVFAMMSACATSAPSTSLAPTSAPRTEAGGGTSAATLVVSGDAKPPAPEVPGEVDGASGAWIGAAAESEMILAATGETYLGVWVDAPVARPRVRAPVDLALVIDTSGSMAGEKIENARSAARSLVMALADGDVVSVDTFSDRARVLVTPTVLDSRSRSRIVGAISELLPSGPTNMFEGLSLAESHMAQAPADHPVRRIVMISDGIANVGPSTPEALGALAERGLRFRAQVTSLGVGNDYDEHTLNALAVRTSGRLFHLSEPREMAAILKSEVELLSASVASDAFVEIVPAPGVQIVSADGARIEWSSGGALRIPLGTLFAGQHREALLRVRMTPVSAALGGARTLASVRLHFHDPAEGDLDRVQEVVARIQTTNDPAGVASHANTRTRAIVAMQQASKLEIEAAERVNQGQFGAADERLATAEAALRKGAAEAKDDREKQRLAQAATGVSHARAATKAAAAAPAPMQRDQALRLNGAGMKDAGY